MADLLFPQMQFSDARKEDHTINSEVCATMARGVRRKFELSRTIIVGTAWQALLDVLLLESYFPVNGYHRIADPLPA